MMMLVAALPMYDWTENRAETDAVWVQLRDSLHAAGFDAPEHPARFNGDLPAVPGGIRDAAGRLIAADPATLDPDGFDLPTLWRHPDLLFAQTCWGPMEQGLAEYVTVLGQPDYSAFEGGEGEFYSSAVLMRSVGQESRRSVAPPLDRRSQLPLDLLRNTRFAFNGTDSMSGLIALTRDLEALGETPGIFSECIETGAHRASIGAVAEGRADVCTVDCRTWDLARRFEPRAAELAVVGWTAMRKGLPFIAAKRFAGDEALLEAVGRVPGLLFRRSISP